MGKLKKPNVCGNCLEDFYYDKDCSYVPVYESGKIIAYHVWCNKCIKKSGRKDSKPI